MSTISERDGTWVDVERAAFVETLREADPAAPTLCTGWTVHRLLAHLVVRESRPDLAAGAARAPAGAEPQLTGLISGPGAPSYQDLLERFASGPPAWTPFAWAPEATNLVEYVVHHEDVRRAAPSEAEPRVLATDMVRALWHRLGTLARLAYRRSPVGVVHAVPGGPRRVVRRRPDAVVVWGDPVELALHALGRTEAADVDVLGRPETVEAFFAAHDESVV
ncbi:TIGR03085 family metal-binding protein [Georgenia alba]|uniref:TIGR03085 family metal-binding protein n=1 Tax=Georgenia alba TaxID=2233858 RepID=A0ABW2QBC7_9MICO